MACRRLLRRPGGRVSPGPPAPQTPRRPTPEPAPRPSLGLTCVWTWSSGGREGWRLWGRALRRTRGTDGSAAGRCSQPARRPRPAPRLRPPAVTSAAAPPAGPAAPDTHPRARRGAQGGPAAGDPGPGRDGTCGPEAPELRAAPAGYDRGPPARPAPRSPAPRPRSPQPAARRPRARAKSPSPSRRGRRSQLAPAPTPYIGRAGPRRACAPALSPPARAHRPAESASQLAASQPRSPARCAPSPGPAPRRRRAGANPAGQSEAPARRHVRRAEGKHGGPGGGGIGERAPPGRRRGAGSRRPVEVRGPARPRRSRGPGAPAPSRAGRADRGLVRGAPPTRPRPRRGPEAPPRHCAPCGARAFCPRGSRRPARAGGRGGSGLGPRPPPQPPPAGGPLVAPRLLSSRPLAPIARQTKPPTRPNPHRGSPREREGGKGPPLGDPFPRGTGRRDGRTRGPGLSWPRQRRQPWGPSVKPAFPSSFDSTWTLTSSKAAAFGAGHGSGSEIIHRALDWSPSPARALHPQETR